MIDQDTGIDITVEPEVRAARRAFPKAQQLLEGVALGGSQQLAVGWHDTALHPEVGAFALVKRGGAHEDLLGDILIVEFKGHSIFVYCVNTADLEFDLSLARRAFVALSRLSRDSIPANVAVCV